MDTELAQAAQEHLQDMPPELQADLGGYLARLSHTELHPVIEPEITDDGWGDLELPRPDFNQRVEIQNLTPEQAAHSERVDRQLERAALFMKSAHQELAGSPDPPTEKDVFTTAAAHAMETAERAAEVDDQQTSIEALETFMVLASLSERGSWEYDTTEKITEAVGKGMADNIVEAAHNLHGLVHISHSDPPRPETLTDNLTRSSRLLAVASDLDFDARFVDIEPRDRTKPDPERDAWEAHAVDQLRSSELLALARAENQKGHTEKAAEVILKVLQNTGNLYGDLGFTATDGPEILVQATELCNAADAQSGSGDFTQQLVNSIDGLRGLRRAGSGNRDFVNTKNLDRTIVGLIKDGQEDLALSLVSSFTADPENLDFAIQEAAGDNVELAKRLSERVVALHIKKSAAFLEHMQAQGVSAALADELRNISADPDSLMEIQDPLFWSFLQGEEYSENPNQSKYDAQVRLDAIQSGELSQIQKLYGLLSQNDVSDNGIRMIIQASARHSKDFEKLTGIAQQVLEDPNFVEKLRDNPQGGHVELFISCLARTSDAQTVWTVAQGMHGTEAIDKILDNGSAEMYTKFLEGYRKSEDKESYLESLKIATGIFGDSLTPTVLEAVEVIRSDTAGYLPEELLNIGLTKFGQAGLDQLKTQLGKFSEALFSGGEIPLDLLATSPVLRSHFRGLVRYDESSWGSTSDKELLRLIQQEITKPHELPEGYVVQDVEIATVDQQAVKDFEVSADAVEVWRQRANALNRALDITNGGQGLVLGKLGELLGEIQASAEVQAAGIQTGIEKLEKRIADMQTEGKDTTGPEKGLAKQQASREALETIDYTAVDNFTVESLCQQIKILADHEEIATSGQLQTLLMVAALVVGGTNQARPHIPVRDNGDITDPTINDIIDMKDFLEHIVDQETWRDLFVEVGGRKQLNHVLDTTAFNDNIERSNNIESAGKRPFRFIPSRGLMLELSGHTGDACWATRYDSIADEFPNFTAITMVQNPDKPSQRIAGSALLIETTSTDGQPLLVLRGINPIQNSITDLTPASFYEQLTGYAKLIAQQSGRQVAVVIDSQSGEAATNRPTLFAYLDGQKPRLQQVKLASADDTTFNGYDITDDTFLVA